MHRKKEGIGKMEEDMLENKAESTVTSVKWDGLKCSIAILSRDVKNSRATKLHSDIKSSLIFHFCSFFRFYWAQKSDPCAYTFTDSFYTFISIFIYFIFPMNTHFLVLMQNGELSIGIVKRLQKKKTKKERPND